MALQPSVYLFVSCLTVLVPLAAVGAVATPEPMTASRCMELFHTQLIGRTLSLAQQVEQFKRLYGVMYVETVVEDSSLGDGFSWLVERLTLRHAPEEAWYRSVLEKGPDYQAEIQRLVSERMETMGFSGLTNYDLLFLYGKNIENRETPNLTINKISNEVGYGVFAEKPLKKRNFIGEYTGILRPFNDSGDNENGYLFGTQYWLGNSVVIDARTTGNITRFINHSRENANCRSLHVFHNGRWHVILVATRGIAAGEQLLFDYGNGYWGGKRSHTPQAL